MYVSFQVDIIFHGKKMRMDVQKLICQDLLTNYYSYITYNLIKKTVKPCLTSDTSSWFFFSKACEFCIVVIHGFKLKMTGDRKMVGKIQLQQKTVLWFKYILNNVSNPIGSNTLLLLLKGCENCLDKCMAYNLHHSKMLWLIF